MGSCSGVPWVGILAWPDRNWGWQGEDWVPGGVRSLGGQCRCPLSGPKQGGDKTQVVPYTSDAAGFHLCRNTSSMAFYLQPASHRSRLCPAHLLPAAPTLLQRDQGESQVNRLLDSRPSKCLSWFHNEALNMVSLWDNDLSLSGVWSLPIS